MPAFFVFAIIFTVLMLEKIRALIVSLLEILLYMGLCLVAYHFPDTVTPFATEADRLADILLAFVSVKYCLRQCSLFSSEGIQPAAAPSGGTEPAATLP